MSMGDNSEEMSVDDIRKEKHNNWWEPEVWSRKELQELSYAELEATIKPYKDANFPLPYLGQSNAQGIVDELCV